jgi:hypothetical protein
MSSSTRRDSRTRGFSRRRFALVAAAAAVLGYVACAGPILPARSKPGGAVKWAESLALSKAIQWSTDATLVSVTGAGIGIEGWLPDRGGEWKFTYTSVAKATRMEIVIDSDGTVRDRETAKGPPAAALPAGWLDSPKVWAATRAHWTGQPVHTLDAELSPVAEPERAAGALVWRIRFWTEAGAVETHVVTPDARWLLSY